MKHHLSQVLQKIISNNLKPRMLFLLTPFPMIFSLLPWQNEENVKWFLIVVIALIILLFIAVAVLLPLTLRMSEQRQRKKQRTETTLTDGPTLPPIPASLVDTAETAPVVPTEDLAATEPGLRSIRAERTPETLPASGPRPAQIGWQIAGLSDTGLRRELNEDNMLMWETDLPFGLYVVADGMGGHDAGEVASGLVIDTIQQNLIDHAPTSTTISFEEWLTGVARAANQVVLANQGDRTEEKKMGSTLVMAMVADHQAHIANVGDSRAYHLNRAGIKQVSIDHSLVERLIQIGQLTREEARTHKQKNVIYNTVGDKEDMEIGLYHVDLQPGDRLLLCSDGLTGMLTDEEILTISRNEPEPAGACKALIEAAKRAGGHDNITAIIVQMDNN